MKFLTALFLVLALVATMALAFPGDIFEFETDNLEHEQDGIPGTAVRGEYTWTDKFGDEHDVKYVADHLGFRHV